MSKKTTSKKIFDDYKKDNNSSFQDLPWFEKYRPKSSKEMVGFDNNIEKIKKFLINFEYKLKKGEIATKEKSILLEGPPGVGKTTVVYAIANDLGYSVIEMNASDARTESEIKKRLQESISSTNLLSYMQSNLEEQEKIKKKLIFIDEVDGISGQSDRGGLATLIKIIESTKTPIIMACNFYDTKFKPLYDITEKINCYGLKKPSIMIILKRIVENEGLNIDEGPLALIAENSGGDLRSAINDLQALAAGTEEVDENEVDSINMQRDVEEKIFSFLETMFKQTTLADAKDIASNTDVDYNILHKVIYANMDRFIPNINDRANALRILADADVLMSRIRSSMDWGALPYFFDLVSGGIVFSIDYPNFGKFKKFEFPNLSSNQYKFVDDPVATELQRRFFLSKHDVMMQYTSLLSELRKYNQDEETDDFIEKMAQELNVESSKLRKYL